MKKVVWSGKYKTCSISYCIFFRISLYFNMIACNLTSFFFSYYDLHECLIKSHSSHNLLGQKITSIIPLSVKPKKLLHSSRLISHVVPFCFPTFFRYCFIQILCSFKMMPYWYYVHYSFFDNIHSTRNDPKHR